MMNREDRKNVRAGILAAFSFVVALCSLPEAAVPAADARDFMWEARSKTATVYLLGSVHFLTRDAYPLSAPIEEAFAKSDVLAVEANINNPDQLFFTKFLERAFYPEGDSLKNHLSPDTYALLREELGKFGLPEELTERERPWFLALTLTSLQLLKGGFDPELGVDMHFLSKAGGKKIVEIESLEYQTELLSGFSDSEQESFLRYTLRDMQKAAKESRSLVTTWKSGDADGLAAVLREGMSKEAGMSSVWEKLLYERNKKMVRRIETFLKSHGTVFVVVGAGHLVGPRGVVEMLRARRYAVEQW
ncbi:MAG: TraB/GumN family protein [Nitrospiraceae bacterium]|nr:TraB/GumN family protein [Nitrospiraceae bacterium]